MAKLAAKTALDMTTLDFASFRTAKNLKYSSSKISFDHGSTRDLFTGKFSVDTFAKKVSGTAYSWTKFNHKTGATYWKLADVKLSAAKVFEAAKTSRTTDDRAIIQAALAGSDSITGSGYADKLYGFNGNDIIEGRGGIDTIDGGAGRDRAVYTSNKSPVEVALAEGAWVRVKANGVLNDKIRNVEDVEGGTGNDKLTGDALANRLWGGEGKDVLSGGDGNDSLWGGTGDDLIGGGKGHDSIDGGSGNDTITGGASADKLRGGTGNDRVDGGSGNDVIDGGWGNDVIKGGSGSDLIAGGAGRDTITGGAARDTVTGGDGADVFVFSAVTDSGPGATQRDYITDFTRGVDRIDLSLIDAQASVTDDQAFVLDKKGSSATAVAEGHIGWYTLNKSGTVNDRTFININVDADAAIEMSIELKGVLKLSAADFIL